MKRKNVYLWLLPLAVILIGAAVWAVFAFRPNETVPSVSIDDYIRRGDNTVSLSSPQGGTTLVLNVNNGQLCYAVKRGDRFFLRESPLGVTVGDTAYGQIDSIDLIGEITGERRTDSRVLNGKKAVADDPCVQALISVDGAAPFTLEARVFDNGVAFRYHLPTDGLRTLKSEETAFYLPADSTVYAGTTHKYYESLIESHDPAHPPQHTLASPATVCLADGGYTAILEGDLQAYPGFALAFESPYLCKTAFENDAYSLSGPITTPWRIIAVAEDLNELVNNTIVYQVCDAPDDALFADGWVKPGRAAWSWITGRSTDRVTPEIMEDYTLAAAKLGFEYNIIDEGWVDWSDYNKTLPALATLGDRYEVGQILWTGVTTGASFKGGIRSAEDAYAFLDLLDRHGLAGGKIDFFTTEGQVEAGVNLYLDILQYAAQKGLVINFHGCNKPTGFDATFPNELNREAILGLESTQLYNRVTQAQMFTTQPFVRGLAGHADFTPAAEEAFHMAQLVLTDAPMQAIGSDPSNLLSSPALEMIKSVPTVWQKTVVLPQSTIAKRAVFARKASSGSWFVGGISQMSEEQDITLDLSLFLGQGTYQYELWIDGESGLERTVGTVTAADTLTVPFAAYEGFIVRFDRVTLSQYGGEIDPATPVTITIHDADTTVAYTLDGSEPNDSSARLQSGDTLPLTDSATLTLKLLSGEDAGLTARYRFNRLP